jgi:hypothetical protein
VCLEWFFGNRVTGAIPIARAPNLLLCVIVARVLLWVWPSPGRTKVALEIVLKGGLITWRPAKFSADQALAALSWGSRDGL